MSWWAWLIIGFFTVFGLQAQQKSAGPNLPSGIPRDWLGLGGGGDSSAAVPQGPIADFLTTLQGSGTGRFGGPSSDSAMSLGLFSSPSATPLSSAQVVSSGSGASSGGGSGGRGSGGPSFIFGRGAIPSTALEVAAAGGGSGGRAPAAPVTAVPLGNRSSGAQSL